jgi:hypothetical protein
LRDIAKAGARKGFEFQYPTRGNFGADQGFVLTKGKQRIQGTVLKTTRKVHLRHSIKSKFRQVCEKTPGKSFVTIFDEFRKQVLVMPYDSLVPALHKNKYKGKWYWQFSLERDPNNPSMPYFFRRVGGGKVLVPKPYVNDISVLFKLPEIKPRTSEALKNRPPIDYKEPPKRVTVKNRRIIRDTENARDLKVRYNDRCQVCGTRLQLDEGEHYPEVHHLRPLGEDGLDNQSNMLVLCPNHHAMFDYRSLGVDPKDCSTIVDRRLKSIGKRLRFRDDHRLLKSYVRYHYEKLKAELAR